MYIYIYLYGSIAVGAHKQTIYVQDVCSSKTRPTWSKHLACQFLFCYVFDQESIAPLRHYIVAPVHNIVLHLGNSCMQLLSGVSPFHLDNSIYVLYHFSLLITDNLVDIQYISCCCEHVLYIERVASLCRAFLQYI